MVVDEVHPADEAHPALIDLRNRGQFLEVLEALNCSLALSRRPSGVALLGVTNGVPTLAACLLPRLMGIAVSGNRLAIATTPELLVFANVTTLAPLYLRSWIITTPCSCHA